MSNVAGSALAPGTTVAGYRIEALIGRGGMGAVYRASEEGLGRKVALKVIAPELAQDERFRERFLRESRIAASLDHPHVIPIYQAGDEDGLLFLAMRYVEGSDLAKVVAEDGALEPKRAVDLLSQIAEALDAAHEKGLIHRDVKPSNVLIAESAGREHCYLGDFGLTKRTGSLSGVSVAGEIVGTLEYVAPEQITGNALDERADVYSLGCVLYECLTGQSPFPRATDVALLWAHVHEEPTPPSKARDDLPKELDTVLTRALAKEPGRRYRSAGELLAATRSALRLGDAPAAPSGRSRARARHRGCRRAPSRRGRSQRSSCRVTRAGSRPSRRTPSASSTPASNELVAEVPVGIDPQAITTGAGRRLGRRTSRTRRSRASIRRISRHAPPRSRSDDYPSDLAVGDGTVWVALGALAELTSGSTPSRTSRRESDRRARRRPVRRPAREHRLRRGARSGSSVSGGPSAASNSGRAPVRASSLACGPRRHVQPRSLQHSRTSSSASTSLWIVDSPRNRVAGVDPDVCQEPEPITVGQTPRRGRVSDGALWVANYDDGTVTKIVTAGLGEPASPTTIEVGDGPVDVAFGEGGIWVANQLGRHA